MAQKNEIEFDGNIWIIRTACDCCWLMENGYISHAVYFCNAKEYANIECPFKVKSDEEDE